MSSLCLGLFRLSSCKLLLFQEYLLGVLDLLAFQDTCYVQTTCITVTAFCSSSCLQTVKSGLVLFDQRPRQKACVVSALCTRVRPTPVIPAAARSIWPPAAQMATPVACAALIENAETRCQLISGLTRSCTHLRLPASHGHEAAGACIRRRQDPGRDSESASCEQSIMTH